MKVYHWICRYFFFLMGLWLMAWATVFSIQAQFGVSSWDVLHIGLSKITTLSIGIWTILIGLIIILTTYLKNKKIPAIGTLLNMLLCGIFVDISLALNWIPVADTEWLQYLWVGCGILCLGMGAGLYISAQLGAGPRDAFTLELAQYFGLSIGLMRTIIEVTVVAIGWLLGGPVFIGTILFALFTGPVMQFSLPRFAKALQLLMKLPQTTKSKVMEKAS